MIFILYIILIFAVFIVGIFIGLKYASNETLHMKKQSDKYLNQLKLSVKWIKDYSKVTDYVIKHKYKKVCIYGMSYMGDCLAELLNQNGVNVVCGIDRNAEHKYSPFMPIYNLSDNIPEADVIIVTVVGAYFEIKKELSEKTKIDIVSLENILYE